MADIYIPASEGGKLIDSFTIHGQFSVAFLSGDKVSKHEKYCVIENIIYLPGCCRVRSMWRDQRFPCRRSTATGRSASRRESKRTRRDPRPELPEIPFPAETGPVGRKTAARAGLLKNLLPQLLYRMNSVLSRLDCLPSLTTQLLNWETRWSADWKPHFPQTCTLAEWQLLSLVRTPGRLQCRDAESPVLPGLRKLSALILRALSPLSNLDLGTLRLSL